jgi:hypothetical protein
MSLRKITCRLVAILALASAAIASSDARAVGISPLTSFGTNGWLAPTAIPQLDTSGNQRGLGVNRVTGNLILVDRDATLGNNAYVLNGTSGAVLGTLTPPSGGYTGGTFVVSMAGVGADGAVYVANLSTSASSPFKVYSWASDSDFSTPATVAFNANPVTVNRIGDSFAVFGSGSSTIWAAAGQNSAAGTNSAFSIGTVDGSNVQTTYSAIAGTTTASNGYRLGLSFIDADTLMGTQGTALYNTDFAGSTATVQATGTIGAAQRPIAYLEHAGVAYFATIDTNSSDVAIFSYQDPSNPVSLFTGNNTSGALSANANGTGSIGWGPQVPGNPNAYTLYAMSSNQGIQAFTVELVPEPSTYAMLSIAGLAGGFAAVRRRRKLQG